MEYYTIVSYRPAELHLQFKREWHSRVVNEELVAVFLGAEALAGDFGTVDGHQVRNPRLEPPTVPFLRECATWNRGQIQWGRGLLQPPAGDG